MRLALVFLAGVTLTLLALRVLPPFNTDRRTEARIGRYQLQTIKLESAPAPGSAEARTMPIIIDTATGKTWYLGEDAHFGLFWSPMGWPPDLTNP